jgi:NAD(P)-dependent dehydrogenase (short-subunit alcohol dehydrogenase family)
LGRFDSVAFAKEGVKVVVADYNAEEAKKTVDQINADGGNAVSVICNVRNEAEVKTAVDCAVNTYGKLDYAINIVGTNTDFKRLHEVPSENFDFTVEVNKIISC